MAEQTRGTGEVRDLVFRVDRRVDALDQKVDRFRDELAARLGSVDRRVDVLDQKVDRFRDELAERISGVDRRVDSLSQKMDGRLDRLDEKVSRQFLWLLGVQVAVLLAVVGALAGG